MIDFSIMQQAIEEGEKARISAPPNPWVGSVIVQNGTVVGRGYSAPAGGPHAEVVALQQAGTHAKEATCYVTLEPCAHHGRTPPCVSALIKAKVARVVVGIEDPDPRVAGKGIAALRKAGITVSVGCLSDKVEESLEPYLYQRRTGFPFCVAKAAVSVDGRIAANDGTSQWISTPEAKESTHWLRAESQAILIGAGTALADNPSLTIRYSKEIPPNPPLRVIFDPKGKVKPLGPLSDTTLAPTLLAIGKDLPESLRSIWSTTEVELWELDTADLKAGVTALFQHLAQRGILQVMVEGGGHTFGLLWKAGLINRLRILVGPRVIGNTGVPLFAAPFGSNLKECPVLNLQRVKQLGQTVQIDYRVANAPYGTSFQHAHN